MARKPVKEEIEKTGVRERLLQSALDIFTRKGYAATSVREIVEAAGVTKPALYYYFGNKEGIYVEFFKKPFGTLETILGKALQGQSSARERVMKLFDSVFLLFLENIKAARLMYSIYYGPHQGAPMIDFEEYHLKMREITRSIVASAVKKGELSKVDVDIFTWALMGVLNFAMEDQLCHRTPQIDRGVLLRMVKLIFDGHSEGKKTNGKR